ncbi:hypothetical protein [Streptomyces bikiniensis]|uniref:hypothetical protein n=1 Tax=Streptomyces bikiniensis TaxID=1896 RepID=UPI0004C1B32B|nr:hypothetical protein [Streptomyces bikiniensis]
MRWGGAAGRRGPARAAELVPSPTPGDLAAAAAAQQEAYEAAARTESAEEATTILKTGLGDQQDRPRDQRNRGYR